MCIETFVRLAGRKRPLLTTLSLAIVCCSPGDDSDAGKDPEPELPAPPGAGVPDDGSSPNAGEGEGEEGVPPPEGSDGGGGMEGVDPAPDGEGEAAGEGEGEEPREESCHQWLLACQPGEPAVRETETEIPFVGGLVSIAADADRYGVAWAGWPMNSADEEGGPLEASAVRFAVFSSLGTLVSEELQIEGEGTVTELGLVPSGRGFLVHWIATEHSNQGADTHYRIFVAALAPDATLLAGPTLVTQSTSPLAGASASEFGTDWAVLWAEWSGAGSLLRFGRVGEDLTPLENATTMAEREAVTIYHTSLVLNVGLWSALADGDEGDVPVFQSGRISSAGQLQAVSPVDFGRLVLGSVAAARSAERVIVAWKGPSARLQDDALNDESLGLELFTGSIEAGGLPVPEQPSAGLAPSATVPPALAMGSSGGAVAYEDLRGDRLVTFVREVSSVGVLGLDTVRLSDRARDSGSPPEVAVTDSTAGVVVGGEGGRRLMVIVGPSAEQEEL